MTGNQDSEVSGYDAVKRLAPSFGASRIQVRCGSNHKVACNQDAGSAVVKPNVSLCRSKWCKIQFELSASNSC